LLTGSAHPAIAGNDEICSGARRAFTRSTCHTRPAFPTCDEAFYWAEILSGVLEPQNLSSNGDVLPFNGASVAWKKLP